MSHTLTSSPSNRMQIKKKCLPLPYPGITYKKSDNFFVLLIPLQTLSLYDSFHYGLVYMLSTKLIKFQFQIF